MPLYAIPTHGRLEQHPPFHSLFQLSLSPPSHTRPPFAFAVFSSIRFRRRLTVGRLSAALLAHGLLLLAFALFAAFSNRVPFGSRRPVASRTRLLLGSSHSPLTISSHMSYRTRPPFASFQHFSLLAHVPSWQHSPSCFSHTAFRQNSLLTVSSHGLLQQSSPLHWLLTYDLLR